MPSCCYRLAYVTPRVFAQDLVDRGPDSVGVVRLVRHLVLLGKAGAHLAG